MDNRLIFLYQCQTDQANLAECLFTNSPSGEEVNETRSGALAMEGRGMVTRAYLLNMVGTSV